MISRILRAVVALALSSAALPALVHAQAAPKATAPVGSAKPDDPITLSVFEVKSDSTDTYEATNTNFITGTNTALNKTPLDAKVFNRQMLDDMGTVDMTEMLWKLGGLGAALIGNGNEDVRGTVEGDRQDSRSTTRAATVFSAPIRPCSTPSISTASRPSAVPTPSSSAPATPAVSSPPRPSAPT